MPTTISEDDWTQVEELAGLCFTPAEIAIIMEWNTEQVIAEFDNPDSEFTRHYRRGEYLHLATVRKAIYNLAKGGSSTSQSDFLKLRKQADMAIEKLR